MKTYGFILFFLLYSVILSAKKILVLEFQTVKNYSIDQYFYDYTEFNDFPLIKEFSCKNYKISAKYRISTIIKYFQSQVNFIKSNSTLESYYLNDKEILKSLFLIDLNYKILEKEGKKYYIFIICFPKEKKENRIIKFLKHLFQ